MSEVTQWLQRLRAGERDALARVFECVYPELKRLAQARVPNDDATLTPTVLVHEAYLRLVGSERLQLVDRRHFFACAARAMRRIAIDDARRRHADKRGGGAAAVTLSEALPAEDLPDTELLALDQALERLDAVAPRLREVVELRFFAGLDHAAVAELLECSERTAKREWERARALLYAWLDETRIDVARD